MKSGTVTIQGQQFKYETGLVYTFNTYSDNRATWVGFNTTFASAPVILADMQTTNGGNPAAIRMFPSSTTGFSFKIDEDHCNDTERRHISEWVAYLAIEATMAADDASRECQVSLYEHWPEGITAGIAGLEAAEQAWGGKFPTGAKRVLRGVGKHPLGSFSNVTSSVKVQGACCKAFAYTSADCSGKDSPQAVESTTQLLPGLPAGVVTPATGISSLWGCNDCAQCVEVTQQC